MKILITGGAGYIGSHVNRLLASRGEETVVLDDLRAGSDRAVTAGRLVRLDLGDRAALTALMEAERFDAVMHFAAYTSVPESVREPGKYYLNNAANMAGLLEACARCGVGYFVFSSSAAVYGEPEYLPIDEAHPTRPINPYGRTKLLGEEMLADFERAHGLKYCALRYFCAAGDSPDSRIGEAHDPETHLIPVMVKAARAGRPFSVFGTDYNTRDGSCVRDFVHVEDLAAAHALALDYLRSGGSSDCFNLGSGEGFTVLEMTAALERAAGRSVPYVLAERRAGDPAVLVAAGGKARRVLGWSPERSDIDTILRDAWNWEERRAY